MTARQWRSRIARPASACSSGSASKNASIVERHAPYAGQSRKDLGSLRHCAWNASTWSPISPAVTRSAASPHHSASPKPRIAPMTATYRLFWVVLFVVLFGC